jgi:hypothetical protein
MTPGPAEEVIGSRTCPAVHTLCWSQCPTLARALLSCRGERTAPATTDVVGTTAWHTASMHFTILHVLHTALRMLVSSFSPLQQQLASQLTPPESTLQRLLHSLIHKVHIPTLLHRRVQAIVLAAFFSGEP